ncbi:electron transfer flavoprotein subunit beta/FixA family protein [bacterium]|nr:electron transfer flavoprotein subunit beta/FixA family protein [candidate division CSSED10-310 bacterium]
MNIAVILKQVPDTEANVAADPTHPGKIVEDTLKFILNPYDEYAVEEALVIAEKSGGEVIGVCIGSDRAEWAIRTAMAMGIHRAVFITDPEAVESDIITQAKILASIIKTLDVSLILCGRSWIDLQEDALAPALGHFLNIAHVSNAGKIDVDCLKATVIRELDGGTLEVRVTLPAVISCSKELNEPRYPTLIAIKRSKNKEIKRVTLSDLGMTPGTPRSFVTDLQTPSSRGKGKIVTGDPADMVKEAVQWLSDEAKII